MKVQRPAALATISKVSSVHSARSRGEGRGRGRGQGAGGAQGGALLPPPTPTRPHPPPGTQDLHALRLACRFTVR